MNKKELKELIAKRKEILDCDICESLEKVPYQCYNAQLNRGYCPARISKVKDNLLKNSLENPHYRGDYYRI